MIEVHVEVTLRIDPVDAEEFDPEKVVPGDPLWQKMEDCAATAVRNALDYARGEGFVHEMSDIIAMPEFAVTSQPIANGKQRDRSKWIIPAEVWLDELSAVTVGFDALPWFQSAAFAEIKELMEHDWAGCEEADNVALWCEDYDPDVAEFFAASAALHALADLGGYECRVNKKDAQHWLKHNRPAWATELGLK